LYLIVARVQSVKATVRRKFSFRARINNRRFSRIPYKQIGNARGASTAVQPFKTRLPPFMYFRIRGLTVFRFNFISNSFELKFRRQENKKCGFKPHFPRFFIKSVHYKVFMRFNAVFH
jgi:hypothetical protein